MVSQRRNALASPISLSMKECVLVLCVVYARGYCVLSHGVSKEEAGVAHMYIIIKPSLLTQG